MKIDNTNKINCLKCKYFAVTWEPRRPKACKLYEFKSAQMPSSVVFRATGSACIGFEKKDAFQEKPLHLDR